jgi:hypothetical protein
MTIRFIGDVHAEFDKYLDIINTCKYPSIQIGDFGIGFGTVPEVDLKHRFIRGNHDDPEACKTCLNWIPDGHLENSTANSMMFIGGGKSIDNNKRIEGVDWWREEELNIPQFIELINQYEYLKPKIMVTHDCPDNIAEYLFGKTSQVQSSSRTRQAFESMFAFSSHTPEVWIFGHHHKGRDTVIDGTRFICLAELAYIDLEIGE